MLTASRLPHGVRSASSLAFSRRLQVLGDVFSKLVEAVPEVAKREEECRLVEDETEKMLSRRGGIDHLQVSAHAGCGFAAYPPLAGFVRDRFASAVLEPNSSCKECGRQKER